MTQQKLDMVDYYWSTDDPHSDNSETMSDFMDNHMPAGAYEIMFDLSESSRDKFVDLKIDLVGKNVEPSTIVSDRQGVIYYAGPGVPDISTLKKILHHIVSNQ